MYKYGVRIQSVRRTCIIVGDNRREIRSDFAWLSFRIKKKKLCEKDEQNGFACLKSWASVGDVID